MKKTVLAVASILLAGSLVAFAGCDDGGSTGIVKGNYKEATAAEATEAVKDIDMTNAFGDPTAENFKLGFEAKANLSFNMSYSMSMNSQTMSEMKADGSLKANYQIVAEPKEDAFNIAGKGDASINANVTQTAGDKTETNKTEMSATVYQDADYLYVDAKMTANDKEQAEKVKISFEDIIDTIMGEIGGSFMTIDEQEVELPDGAVSGGVDISMNLGTVISALAEEGFTVALDQSSGTKIKISAGKELILSLIGEAGDELPVDLSGLEFSASEIAVYLSFDKDGKFVQAGVNVNVAATMDVSEQGMGMKVDVSIKGGVELKLFNGTVTLPEGIADDTTYELETL